jgi:hypothetical protein
MVVWQGAEERHDGGLLDGLDRKAATGRRGRRDGHLDCIATQI